jgi:NNP family nitrate/nitrite transporter-like MFS transporter
VEFDGLFGVRRSVGACGGYLIPRGFGASIAATGGPYVALLIFLLFYVTCLALNWWYYMRKSTVLGKANV